MGAADAVRSLSEDLRAEQASLDAVVADRPADELLAPTPAEGWTVVDQLSHLAGFDGTATTAIVDPERFNADLTELLETGTDPIAGFTDRGRAMTPDAVVAWWRAGRVELLDAVAAADPSVRVPWYGPPMSLMSFVTARLMETWAHGTDVVDAVGASRPASDRLVHVAQLGVEDLQGGEHVALPDQAPQGPERGLLIRNRDLHRRERASAPRHKRFAFAPTSVYRTTAASKSKGPGDNPSP